MSALDLSNLTPQDAQAALRSYPRRFRSLLAPMPDDDIDELAHRAGPDGDSAIAVTSDVTRTWVLLGEGLRQIAVADTPVLHPAVADPSLRDWETPPPDTVDDAVELLTLEANALADAIGDLPIGDWNRSGSVAGGSSVTAIELVRDAVRTGHDGLGRVEQVLGAVRR